MTRTAIHVDHIARVEGHGNVRVVIEDGIVKTVEMNVVEPARLFESMVRGRRFEEVPYIASRICGICSASHVVTDLLAIERVFGDTRSRVDRPHARAARPSGVRLLPAEPRHAPVRVRRAGLPRHAERVPAGRDGSRAVRAGACAQGAWQRAVHEGGRAQRASHHGGRGRLHARDRGRGVPGAGRQDGRGAGVRDPGRRSVPRLSRSCHRDGRRHAGHGGGRGLPVAASRRARFLKAGAEFDADEASERIEEHAVPHSAALFARVRETGRRTSPRARPRERLVAAPRPKRQGGRGEGGAAPARGQSLHEQRGPGGGARRCARPLRGAVPPPRRAGRLRGRKRARRVRGAGRSRHGLHRGTARRALP